MKPTSTIYLALVLLLLIVPEYAASDRSDPLRTGDSSGTEFNAVSQLSVGKDPTDNPSFGSIQDEPQSLADCVKIALDKNPLNRSAREGVTAAKETVGEARAPYYPELGLRSGYSRWQRHAFLPTGVIQPGISTVIGPTDDWSAGLASRFTLFDSFQRRAELGVAKAKQGIAEEDAARIRHDLVLNVHQAYFGLVAALEVESVARKSLARAEEHLRLASERKAVGAVPQADVVRAQVEVADAGLVLARAEGLVRLSKGNLNTSMGLPVETRVTVEAQARETTAPDAIHLSTALKDAVQTRPELKAAVQRIAAARHAVSAAKSAFGPQVKVEGGYGWRDNVFFPSDKDWSVGLSIELPLFTGFSRTHGLGRSKAELSREEAETDRLIQAVRQEVWSAHSKLREAYEAVRASDPLVRDAQESLRLARERYGAGAGTINDLLDSETALARAEAVRVESQWDYHIARAVFDRSVGKLVVEEENP
jgi:outer membrane protein TolC